MSTSDRYRGRIELEATDNGQWAWRVLDDDRREFGRGIQGSKQEAVDAAQDAIDKCLSR